MFFFLYNQGFDAFTMGQIKALLLLMRWYCGPILVLCLSHLNDTINLIKISTKPPQRPPIITKRIKQPITIQNQLCVSNKRENTVLRG
jgi:hypothetical protein